MFRRAILTLALLAAASLVWAYVVATSAPVVRRATLRMEDWPTDEQPVTVLLMSDIHVAGPDMPPERLASIVGQANGLRPDLVLIAGDLVSDKRVASRYYGTAEAIAPLAHLAPRLGTYAVLGNHDHWRNGAGARHALRAAGVTLIENRAIRVGPLALGGVDDLWAGKPRLDQVVEQLRGMEGARLLLSHNPDIFPKVPPHVGLVLAGHTHCGQIVPPITGPLITASKFGRRYACGLMNEHGRTLIVTAGLGTSGLPLRLGAVPDMWLLTLGGH